MRVGTEPFNLASEVAEAVGIRWYVVGGATLIACSDAVAFLMGCQVATIRVLGAEGFDVVAGNRRPDMLVILDLSDVEEPSRSTSEARQFVDSVCRDSLWLEFELERI